MGFKATRFAGSIVALAVMGSVFGSSSASAHEGDCKPAIEWDYTEDELSATLIFDLSECWGNNPFVGKIRFWRSDQTAGPLATPAFERSGWSCHVDKSRECRVKVAIEHPDIEIADYRLDLEFFRQNGKRVFYGVLWPRCVSAGVAYSDCGP